MAQLHIITRAKLHFGLNPLFTTLSDEEFAAKRKAVVRAIDKLEENHFHACLNAKGKREYLNHWDAFQKYAYMKRQFLTR